ncbi:MAG: alpha/beta hydrolase [Clostridia bacterium]|nr:alpha/beta hydrolase [Clostridia bacterium]
MKTEKLLLREYFPVLGESNATLETFLPYNMTEMNRQDQKRPCMLICPGGGYPMCSQRDAEPIASRFAAMGYNAFVLWYSVAPVTFPAQIREVAAAMELIYKNADVWNCDTDKIAISGFSAGGHLAAHYSNAYNCPEVREVFPESKAPNASVLCYPVITADPNVAHLGSFDNLTGKGTRTEEEITKFSCDRLVSNQTPPAFVWHTAEDNCVPVANSLLYTKALSEHNVPFELHIYPYGAHGLATVDEETNGPVPANVSPAAAWIKDSGRFLKMIFG